MKLQQYKKEIKKTWIKSELPILNLFRIITGIGGECGEIQEKIKKWLRGDFETYDLKKYLKKEIGDIMYYIVMLCNYFNLDLEKILDDNIEKLRSRKQRGVIKGSGDSR